MNNLCFLFSFLYENEFNITRTSYLWNLSFCFKDTLSKNYSPLKVFLENKGEKLNC